jgi:hypothetical protein
MLNYNTTTNQPSVSQLQPVPDNTNQLYIKLGNPNLKQEFTHALRLNGSFVNPYKNRNFFFYLTFMETQNKIVNYDRINSFGIDSVMPVNVNGVYNMNSNISFGFPVRFLKGSIDISSVASYSHGKQFAATGATTEMNIIKTITAGPEVRLDMNPTEKITLSFNAGVNYSRSKYSILSTRNSKYFTQGYGAEFDWELPKKFFFSTDFDYSVNNLTADYNTKIPLWNASISKQVLKFNRGEFKFAVKDLLDKNIRVNRSSNQNYIEDTRTNSLRRFFLVSFTYSLSKTGLNNAGGGMRVMMK